MGLLPLRKTDGDTVAADFRARAVHSSALDDLARVVIVVNRCDDVPAPVDDLSFRPQVPIGMSRRLPATVLTCKPLDAFEVGRFVQVFIREFCVHFLS